MKINRSAITFRGSQLIINISDKRNKVSSSDNRFSFELTFLDWL